MKPKTQQPAGLSVKNTNNQPPQKLQVFAQTDIGKVRSGNEDSFLAVDTTSEQIDELPVMREYPLSDKGLILMVSDGMGGAAAGEVASRLAVVTAKAEFHFDSPPDETEFVNGLEAALHTANQVIYDHTCQHPETYGMGATATTAGILPQKVFIGQIGDSRAYLICENAIEQMTRDQSFVNQLVEAGKITEEEAENHPRKNVILQALGNQEELEVAFTSFEIQQGDFLLLCSDGLTSKVKKEELLDVVLSETDLKAACHKLVDLANARGGHDNITVVLGKFV